MWDRRGTLSAMKKLIVLVVMVILGCGRATDFSLSEGATVVPIITSDERLLLVTLSYTARIDLRTNPPQPEDYTDPLAATYAELATAALEAHLAATLVEISDQYTAADLAQYRDDSAAENPITEELRSRVESEERLSKVGIVSLSFEFRAME
jgi:hypothetical protein